MFVWADTVYALIVETKLTSNSWKVKFTNFNTLALVFFIVLYIHVHALFLAHYISLAGQTLTRGESGPRDYYGFLSESLACETTLYKKIKNIKNVKRCRDDMPKSMRTR